MSVMMSEPLIEALRELGIDTNHTRRVVIDLQAREPAVIHVERYGDERLLQVVRALEGVEIRREGSSGG